MCELQSGPDGPRNMLLMKVFYISSNNDKMPLHIPAFISYYFFYLWVGCYDNNRVSKYTNLI